MLPLPARDRSSNDRNDKHNKKGVHKRAHKSKEIKSAVLFGKSSDSRLRPASFQEKAAESHDDKLAQSNDKATVGHVPNVKSPDTFSKPRGHFRPSKAALVKQFINTSDDNQYYCELCFRHYEPGEFHHKFSMHEDRRDFLFNYVGLQCLDEWSNDRIYVTISLQLESTLKEICPNRKYINMSDQQLDYLCEQFTCWLVKETKYKCFDLKFYGSKVNGYDTVDSDLNILIQAHDYDLFDDFKIALQNVWATNTNIPTTIDQKDGCIFKFIFPKFFADTPVTVVLKMPGAYNDVVSSRLIRKYLTFDERAAALCQLFRYWIRNCNLDDPLNGGWPSLVWPVLVIRFCQTKGILPFFFDHPDYSNGCESGDDSKLNDVPQFHVDAIKKTWKNGKQTPLIDLWIDFLKFLIFELNESVEIITIRNQKNKLVNEKKLALCGLLVENPFKPANILTSHNRPMYLTEFKKRLMKTYARFKINDYSIKHRPFKVTSIFRKKPKAVNLTDYNFVSNVYLNMLKDSYLEFAEIDETHKFSSYSNLFQFDSLKLNYCTNCCTYNHSVSKCKHILPKLFENKLNPSMVVNLDKDIMNYFDNQKLTKSDRNNYLGIIRDFQRHLRNHFGSELVLAPYGSFSNSLASNDGDCDLSLKNFVLDQNSIEEIANVMKKMINVVNVTNSPNAFVPVVKFQYQSCTFRDNLLDFDLTINNEMGEINSFLIKKYCLLDKRVPPLCFFAKLFAKKQEICPRIIGGLSSFAIVLMMIYFLQCHDPPVLPSLQQMAKDQSKRTIVEGEDCTFELDLKRIKSMWKQKNHESIGVLFLKFLRFYGGEFDFENNVISVRVGDKLTREEKGWQTHSTICIEDPFIMNRDLAEKIYRSMHFKIQLKFASAHNNFSKKLSSEQAESFDFQKEPKPEKPRLKNSNKNTKQTS